MEQVTVESYAGSEAEEYPLRFYAGGRKIEIMNIARRWLIPGSRCFRVTGDDGWTYVLQYNIAGDTWSLLTTDRP